MAMMRSSAARCMSQPARLIPAQQSISFIRHNSNSTSSKTQLPPKSDASESPAPTAGDSAVIRRQGPSEAMAHHGQPDYDAIVDQATSSFSPVPKRVMNGSEEGIVPAAITSGAPVDLQARTVRIYRPTKTATQSGNWHGHQWRMDWDVQGKGHRWENFLMGWQSSADFMQGTHLNFTSKEDAIRFAERQGYEYFVQEHNERKIVPKAYANNFLHTFKKLKHIRTK